MMQTAASVLAAFYSYFFLKELVRGIKLSRFELNPHTQNYHHKDILTSMAFTAVSCFRLDLACPSFKMNGP